MYTSDIDATRRSVLRCAAGNLGFSLFCAFFGAVYEHFSFGVYSNWMLFAFAPPLLSGFVLLLMGMGRRAPSRLFLQLFTLSAVTFAVGAIAAGVVEIYGTENRLLTVYPIAGGILLALAGVHDLRTILHKQGS